MASGFCAFAGQKGNPIKAIRRTMEIGLAEGKPVFIRSNEYPLNEI